MEVKKVIGSIPKLGDISEDVATVQVALNEHNAELVVDGAFGIKTKSALVDFQKANKLKGTGIPGEKTIALLGLKIAPANEEPKQDTVKVTRAHFAKTMLQVIGKDIDAGLRETKGKNRSPRIDEINKRAHTALGSPYCAAGYWCAVDDACKILGLKNPAPPTASSQAFRKDSYVPKKFIRPEGALGQIGDAGVLQVRGDSSHGHLVAVAENQTEAMKPKFKTGEYNTDGSGSRDGDGAYWMTRSTQDGSFTNSGKLFICFTDVPGWVLEANGIEE